ncbi:TatD family hydrolase [Methylophilus aquaticus]|uniref:TatD family hydrolase n=1 Tax=Methylophilus aquaticus TaxID=1971610 RepID=A0ABT9JUV2_9PROT|nr:TatD family hydrolase [Methylophilus aquaticus]MDP8568280.1 TatD family hydrolase [Methylophilus aquaticus]
MLIDTHCHLDATEFDADREMVWQAALQAGVRAVVIPAVTAETFQPIMQWCAQHPQAGFALGWHPMYIEQAPEDALLQLEQTIKAVLAGPQAHQLLAIGEIGLDFYLSREHEAKQLVLFEGQLQIAKQFDVPVILHVRGAIDSILKYLRKHQLRGGIAHAFNGSLQQAGIFCDLGFKLGFGGAMTWPRALKIRQLAAEIGLESLVLETDAPDIPPVWLGHQGRNSPDQLKKIAEEMSSIRRIEISQIIEITGKNSLQVLPKIAHLCT